MNKRGVTFTYITLLFLVVILLLFAVYTKSRTKFEVEMTTVVAENMDRFVINLQNDYVPAALKSSMYRAVLVLEEKIIEKRVYLDGDTANYIKYALIDGKFTDGTAIQPAYSHGNNPQGNNPQQTKQVGDGLWLGNMKEDAINYTLENIARQLEQLAQSSGLKLKIEPILPEDVSVYQTDAYNLGIRWAIKYSISHSIRNITWSLKQNTFETTLPITEFYAPSYLVHGKIDTNRNPPMDDTRHNMSRPLVLTDYPIPLGSAEKVEESIVHNYVYANPNAPSFLKTLGGDFSPDPMGISMFVDPRYYPFDLSPENPSGTDYNYFERNTLCILSSEGILPLPGNVLPQDPLDLSKGGFTICFGQEDYSTLVNVGGYGHWVCEAGTMLCKWVSCSTSTPPEQCTNECTYGWNIRSILPFDEGGSSNGEITPDSTGQNMDGTITETCGTGCTDATPAITRVTTGGCKYGTSCYNFKSSSGWTCPAGGVCTILKYYKGWIKTPNIPEGTGPTPGTDGPLSIEMWFKIPDANTDASGYYNILTMGNPNGWSGMILGYKFVSGQAAPYFTYTPKTGAQRSTLADPMAKITVSSLWHHLAITCGPEVPGVSQGGVRVYIDGVLTKANFNDPDPKCLTDGTSPIWIGGSGPMSSWSGMFHGMLDEVIIYGKELSQEEVSAHYNTVYDFCYNPA